MSVAVLRASARVLFGPGSVGALERIAPDLGDRFVVCTDPRIAAGPALTAVRAALDAANVAYTVFAGVEPDVPLAVVDDAVAAAREIRANAVIGLGGGSSIDVAKLTALRLRHGGSVRDYYGDHRVPGPVDPIVAIPTTAGTGSEVTPVAVVSDPERRLKVGVSSPHLIPAAALCDSTLTRSCPPVVTAHAGIDALAHAIEAFTAVAAPDDWTVAFDRVFIGKNAVSDALALAAVAEIGRGLVRAVADGDDAGARDGMLLGSTLAGLAFAQAGTAVAHALQYPLGAATGTPHGLGVGLLLPYVMRFNLPAREPELAAVGRALGVVDQAAADGEAALRAVDGVADLCRGIGLPPNLAELGLRRADLPGLAREAVAIERLVANNPRRVDVAALESILEAAFDGRLTY